ncbi:MAG: alkaline phosphatase D family protein [Planctomycetia bacterium]|nr:alkaline phosphatase D family protein [Planctomycetia bacterium]
MKSCLRPRPASIGFRPPALALAAVLLVPHIAPAADFASQFADSHDRVWIGPEYWANPMEDWRVHQGRLECLRGGENRNVHLLTRELGKDAGDLAMSVRLGRVDQGNRKGSAGFAIGVRDRETDHWQSSLLFGEGLPAGVTAEGVLFIDATQAQGKIESLSDVELRLVAQPEGQMYSVELSAHDPASGRELARVAARVVAEQLVGNLAIVSNHGANRRPHVPGEGELSRWWFRHWKVSGSKVEAHDDRRFGPILYAMHTLSRGVWKMTAQMPPLGELDSQTVRLQVQWGGAWGPPVEERIDPLSCTATFRIENWDAARDVPYRLVYSLAARDGKKTEHYFTGTVRKDPVAKEEIVVAGFTGNTDTGFPNVLVARNVAILDPDVLFFSGDEIYENVGGYGIFRQPVKLAALNYLRKIYLWGWAFRDVMRDRPTLVLPDDHDVYQGNIWGEGGRDCGGIQNHDRGGYAMPAEWVNAVQRTLAAHHPDPFDPTPIEQGITVYYGDLLYGRISFAVIEDRKFKSGPAGKVNTWPGRPDHVKDKSLDPKTLDKPGLELLGGRQLKFLRAWAADWKGADMKLALSQTIFCNLANYHGPEQEYLVADLDSNGWPQSGRNAALVELRKGFALHFAGDQHLASIVHHGIDDSRDAGYSFCVPSIAAGYPRSWRPDSEGKPVRNRLEPGLPNTGDYFDGLGNRVTVLAVGNPAQKNRAGRINTLHDKASGFSIVRMNKPKGTYTMECYRLQIDAKNLKPDDHFPGWPRTIHMTENDGRPAAAWLSEMRVSGMENPVVQIVDDQTGEIVYTLRIRGTVFRPKVFEAAANYTVRIGDPDRGRMQTIRGIKAQGESSKTVIDVKF